MPDIFREMMQLAIAALAERDLRIAAMEAQLAAMRQQNRKLTADLLRLLRKGPR